MTVLPEVAREESLLSYLEMKKSKEEHLDLLIALDTKRKSGKNVSLVEEARLATLLEKHSKNVQAFADQIARLKESHPGQEKTLLTEIERSSR